MSPPRGRLAGFARSVLRGYLSLARGLGGVLLFLAAVVAATATVALPLWLLATRLPGVFTVLTVSAFAAAFMVLLIAGARRQVRLWGSGRAWLRKGLRPAAARAGVLLGLVAGAYGLLLLVASGRTLLALPAGVALAILIGLWAQRHRSTPHEEGPPPADDRRDGPSP